MNDRCIGFIEIAELNAAWREVLPMGTKLLFKKGEQVPQSEYLAFLHKGVVRLTHCSRDGKQKILWYIGAGCIFGETPFFDPQESLGGGVHVCTTACEVYAFSRECVYKKIAVQRPDLMLNLLPSMARKVRMLSNHASSLYLDDVTVRVCKFLGQRIIPGSSPLLARPGISRQELASLLGVHRITLFKSLKHLEEYGICGPYEHDTCVILQPERFFELMDS